MKRLLIYSSISIFLFLLVPLSIYSIPKPQETPTPPWIPPQKITVHLAESKQTVELNLEDCVEAWLSASVLETTPLEALKAQAVAARSYLLYQIYANQQSASIHPDTMLCNDGGHCMSFYPEYYSLPLLHQAVTETAGEYLSYHDLPARCFFFSVSAGRTESALDVWGMDLPYLISVESPEDSRSAAFQSKVTYPLEAFQLVLRGANHNLNPSTSLGTGEVSRSETGHVKFIDFYGERFTGEELKELFHLNSTNFNLFFNEKKVVFEVKGKGHGVGMSLYGAQEMAKKGQSYQAILSHYYPGTRLTTIHPTN